MSEAARSRPKLHLIPRGAEQRASAEQAGQDHETSNAARGPTGHEERQQETSQPSQGRSKVAAGALAALSDAELVALGSQGNRIALEVLFRRHAPFALRLATRIEGSARDADDVVHDAFLKAFERLQDLTDPSAFRSWLGAIIVRDVRSHLRRAKLMRTLGLVRSGEPVELDALASTEASPAVRAQVAQVYALLHTQPVDDRIAWILRSVEGHDLEAVAQISSCSLATAKRRIARVQKFLGEHFVDSYAEGEP